MRDHAETDSADVVENARAFYVRLSELLAVGERLALCTIVRLAGSGPRRAGARMLVRHGAGSIGTVGGGVLEVKATAWGKEALENGRSFCRLFALDLQQASDEGMTCGGEVEVLVEPFDESTKAVRDFFGKVADLLVRGQRGWLATTITGEGENTVTAHYLIAGGLPLAALPESGGGLPEDLLRAPAPVSPSLLEWGSVRCFVEPLTPPITVYVFGGGHVGTHLVPLCERVGFRTIVVDDRADLVSQDRFPQAHEVFAVPSFEGVFDGLPVDEDSYVVILTRGHGGDQAVLRQALRHRPAYIGMIGSKRKRRLIFDQLLAEGFTQADLARVACPVGLPIGAETPEEIAVSILAQLIATRAARRGTG